MLSLDALGVPRLRYRDQPLVVRGKPLGLLCWLALRGPASRAEAAELLWPGEGTRTLRQHLYLLRRLPGAPEWWSDGPDLRVQAQTDVAQVQDPADDAGRERALGALSATLLEGLEHLPDPFLEWLELERQRLSLLRRTLLFETALARRASGDLDLAAERLTLLLRLDPLHESACRELMRLEAGRGRGGLALSHFETLREQLRLEMNVAPLPETVDLARELAAPASPAQGSLALRQAVAVTRSTRPEWLARMLDQDPLAVAAALDRLPSGALQGGQEETLLLTPTLRALLHLRAAETLEALDGPGEAVAEHLLQAGRPEEAASALLRSAGRVTDVPGAARLAARGLQLGLAGRDRAQALGLVFRQAELQRDVERLTSINAELTPLAFALQDDPVYFQLYRQRASAARLGGDLAGALTWAEEALAVALRLEQADWRAEAEVLRGTVLYMQGHLAEAEAALRRGLETGDVQTRLRAHSGLGAVYGMGARLHEALEQQELSLTLSRAHAPRDLTAQVLFNLANTALQAGRWARAAAGFHEAAVLLRELGRTPLEAQALSALAHVHHLRGHFGAAWNTAQEVLELTPTTPGSVTALGVLASLARRCGEEASTRTWSEQALALAREQGQTRLALISQHNLMLLGLSRGEAASPALLTRMEEAGIVPQREECQAELALSAPDAATFAWASAAWEAPGTGPAAPIARALLTLARLRASLRGWASPALLDADLRAVLTELPREAVPALTLWAAHLERLGRAGEAAACRAEAAALAQEQAQGLPRDLRAAFLAGVAQGRPWT